MPKKSFHDVSSMMLLQVSNFWRTFEGSPGRYGDCGDRGDCCVCQTVTILVCTIV
jgi:hypothetical protein